jgi:DNA-binding transcriptional ArsR family regulator
MGPGEPVTTRTPGLRTASTARVDAYAGVPKSAAGKEVQVTTSAVQRDDPPAEALQSAAAAFGLLASTMRLHIVWILSQSECDVTGLADRIGATLPAVSQHLAKLKLAGLVQSRREGRRQVYLVDDPDIVTVVRVMVGQQAERVTAPRRARLGA